VESANKIISIEARIFIICKLNNSDFASLLVDEAWLLALSFILDIFPKLKELNISLQGNSSSVLDAYDKIKAFEKNWNYGLIM
jgi:hypothetical protein